MLDPPGLLNNGRVAIFLGLLVVAVAASASFALTRAFSDGDSATADTGSATVTPEPAETWPPYPPGEGPGRGPAYVDPPGPDVTPIPGATPDTTQPWWHVPYENAERGKPFFRGEINGIRVTEADGRQICDAPQYTTPQEADATDLSALSRSLPLDATREDLAPTFMALWCDDEIVFIASMFVIPSDDQKGLRGGQFTITRFRGDPDVRVDIPEDRWSAATLAGHPAAIARPILPDLGLGESAVVVWERERGVITVVQGFGVTLAQMLAVAEGLY